MSNRTVILIAGATLLMSVVMLRLPTQVVLDDSCIPRGALNSLRAQLHKDRFWASQRLLIDRDLRSIVDVNAKVRQAEETSSVMHAKTERLLDSIYASTPGLPERPGT